MTKETPLSSSLMPFGLVITFRNRLGTYSALCVAPKNLFLHYGSTNAFDVVLSSISINILFDAPQLRLQ